MGKIAAKRIWIKGRVIETKTSDKGGVSLIIKDDGAGVSIAIPKSCYVNKRVMDGETFICIDTHFKKSVLKNSDKLKALKLEELQRLFKFGAAA